MITLRDQSGWPLGKGSGSVTSRPAAATRLLSSASTSAFVSITPPRETLIRITPFFIIANCVPLIIFLDSLVSGTALATTSRPGQERVEGIGPVQLFDERRAFEDLGVGCQNSHAERGGAAGDFTADTAQANDQERLARELVEDHLGSVRTPFLF